MSEPISFFETSIEIHNFPVPEFLNNSDYDYGILKISAEKVSITRKPIFFRFTTDCSGSMSDKCKDGRTKMDHIQHTMCNMIRFFADNEEASVYIQVHAFDDKIHKIIPTTQVNKFNLESLIIAIGKMHPMQSTNIELALGDAAISIEEYISSYPDHSISHIFLTDGDATSGNRDADYLSSLVTKNISNTFIAFGTNHSASIMQKLGSANKNSSNWLIDKLENAGLVYGEILNNELFKVLEQVEISMTDGLIYDYKKGEFSDKLCPGNLVSEVQKTYHILAKNKNVLANISGVKCNKFSGHRHFSQESMCCNEKPCDLTTHIFRLRTQQIMFESKKFEIKHVPLEHAPLVKRVKGLRRQNAIPTLEFITEIDPDEQPVINIGPDPLEIFKNDATNFLGIMQKYMKDNDKEGDLFMKALCDDIYLTIRSLGTSYQSMCIGARETSQGSQQCYNVFDFDLEPDQDYSLSQTSINYANQTSSVRNLMRSCSAPLKKKNILQQEIEIEIEIEM